MITAKILVTSLQGYLDNEQLPKQLTDFPIVVRSAIEYRNHETMIPRCVVNKAKNHPLASHQSFSSRETPSCRLYPAAQLAGVTRDGQGLASVPLLGLTFLVNHLVLEFF